MLVVVSSYNNRMNLTKVLNRFLIPLWRVEAQWSAICCVLAAHLHRREVRAVCPLLPHALVIGAAANNYSWRQRRNYSATRAPPFIKISDIKKVNIVCTWRFFNTELVQSKGFRQAAGICVDVIDTAASCGRRAGRTPTGAPRTGEAYLLVIVRWRNIHVFNASTICLPSKNTQLLLWFHLIRSYGVKSNYN